MLVPFQKSILQNIASLGKEFGKLPHELLEIYERNPWAYGFDLEAILSINQREGNGTKQSMEEFEGWMEQTHKEKVEHGSK